MKTVSSLFDLRTRRTPSPSATSRPGPLPSDTPERSPENSTPSLLNLPFHPQSGFFVSLFLWRPLSPYTCVKTHPCPRLQSLRTPRPPLRPVTRPSSLTQSTTTTSILRSRPPLGTPEILFLDYRGPLLPLTFVFYLGPMCDVTSSAYVFSLHSLHWKTCLKRGTQGRRTCRVGGDSTTQGVAIPDTEVTLGYLLTVVGNSLSSQSGAQGPTI